jgi:hypothetical protein
MSILRCVVAIDEGSSKLGVFLEGPPLSLFDVLLMTRGVQELHVPFVVHPLLKWFICLLGRGSFRYVPCFPLIWVLWLIYG